ncbi:prephenate dehydrogenase [Mariprofundus ferrinatatus]|uniref:prephenate dehydrogenase n=1 Tax=Mariprofundus ferrinatatus TaxID=1921087 RepID=A0A2K8L2G0_9PROT|nr:prephenate dehydrogenase/arogenate dehydrogenase family protein [Mariprofundus ferrinatatus]ATX81443.1 prephenate dehydrogenase [Mariprofundus ferrinatatus]
MSATAKPSIGHLVIVGVGLIGGSFSLALKRAGLVGRVTGVGRSRDNLELAQRLGIVDAWTHDVGEAVRDADVVLLAVPMSAFESVFADMAASLSDHAVVTDAGSTKQSAIAAARKFLPNPSRFIAAHPIAGTEQSGAGAAFAELFEKRLCVLAPDPDSDPDALALVKALWHQVGSRVVCMGAAEHDDFLAAVSHLPHLAAFALVNAVRRQSYEGHDPFRFAAGGFRDFTRIASSSPEMWRDIALCNSDALVKQIDAFQAELSGLREALMAADGESIMNEFKAAKEAREKWLAEHGDGL